MPTDEQIYIWIYQLASDDETERTNAEKEILALEKSAIPYLNRVRGRRDAPKAQILRMIGLVCDNHCTDKLRQNTIELMQMVIRSTLKSFTPDQKAVAREILERWGEEIPEQRKPVVLHCHKCNKPSTEIKVRTCFLPECKKSVCEDHVALIEGGYEGTWFCSEEHKNKAMKNPSILM